MLKNRRTFIKSGLLAGAGLAILPGVELKAITFSNKKERYKISLAEWSLNKMLFAGKLKNIDFPKFTKDTFGINAVEYVNTFFKDKANDKTYLKDLKKRCKDEGVESVLIMIDQEGNLGDANENNRKTAIENHYKWIEASEFLGCHSIRVNARGHGNREDVAERVIESLSTLSNFAKDYNQNVLVENHGGYSSDGKWLADIMRKVNMPNCGTLPDFGNFIIDRNTGEEYDRYLGMEELMPFAKAVSAKCYEFDESGKEKEIDFYRIMNIVQNAGYSGYIGIEYEYSGKALSEVEGIKAAKKLLEEVFKTL